MGGKKVLSDDEVNRILEGAVNIPRREENSEPVVPPKLLEEKYRESKTQADELEKVNKDAGQGAEKKK